MLDFQTIDPSICHLHGLKCWRYDTQATKTYACIHISPPEKSHWLSAVRCACKPFTMKARTTLHCIGWDCQRAIFFLHLRHVCAEIWNWTKSRGKKNIGVLNAESIVNVLVEHCYWLSVPLASPWSMGRRGSSSINPMDSEESHHQGKRQWPKPGHALCQTSAGILAKDSETSPQFSSYSNSSWSIVSDRAASWKKMSMTQINKIWG